MEVEALIQTLERIPPPEKIAALGRLLKEGKAGLDDVFLVALNENDPEILQVVSLYFRSHHPPEAIEPLIDVMQQVQGDREMREHVADTLATFGPSVVEPLVRHRRQDPPERWGDGGTYGFERILGQVFRDGGAPLLNLYLKQTPTEDLGPLVAIAGDQQAEAMPADVDTIRLVGHHLGRVRDADARSGLLRLLHQIGKGEKLPPNLGDLAPLLDQQLRRQGDLWGLYATMMVGGPRNTPALIEQLQQGGARRFWAIQALALVGSDVAADVVGTSFTSREVDIRSAAAWAVHHRLWTRVGPAAIKALSSTRPPSLALVQAVGHLRGAEARPALEGALPEASREVQAAVLTALLPLADQAMTYRLMNWVVAEFVAPSRVGRLSLNDGPNRDVLAALLPMVAAFGGVEGRDYLTQLRKEVGPALQTDVDLALHYHAVLPGQLPQLLRRLGEGPPQPMTPLRRSLFTLAAPLGSQEVRLELETLLLKAPDPQVRLEAAYALFFTGTPASIPALKSALEDPWFVAGPFPVYEFPVRRVCAAALVKRGVEVVRRPDRTFSWQ